MLGRTILDLRKKRKGLQAEEAGLVELWKKALGPHQTSGGGLKLVAIRKYIFKPSMVPFLVERKLYNALRPVPDGLEGYYEDRVLSITDVHPHIEKIDVSYRVDPEDRAKPRKKAEEAE